MGEAGMAWNQSGANLLFRLDLFKSEEKVMCTGILIIIHGMLLSVAMVLCILISVLMYFTWVPEGILLRNKNPNPEMYRTSE